MSRILAYTSPASGHLFPLAPVLLELRRRGHEVALRTFASKVETMRGLGFEAAPIAPAIEAIEMDDWRAQSHVRGMQRSGEVLLARARLDAPDLLGAIERERPDALLVDVLSWGALSAAESWGGPWACFAPLPLPLVSRDRPPMGLGLRPAQGWAGRSRDRLLRTIQERGFDRVAGAELRELRASLGLPAFAHGEDLFRAPPLLLAMTAEPFDYPHSDWPESVVMVGPCNWEPPAELPAQFADVEEPLVLVTTSSEFQDDGRLVSTALEALAGEPVHVVATTPAGSVPVPSPDNATVLEFAPHGPILERAVCAITHGGMGATQKALSHGVPVCAVPFGRDQFEVARRVEFAEAGSRLTPRRLSPDRLRDKVREARRRGPGAERVAAAFAAAGGEVAAADALERELGLSAAGPP